MVYRIQIQCTHIIMPTFAGFPVRLFVTIFDGGFCFPMVSGKLCPF